MTPVLSIQMCGGSIFISHKISAEIIMKLGMRPFFLFITLSATAFGMIHAEEREKKQKFPEWKFCIAHTIRDADKRDERPQDPEEDPIAKEKTTIPYGSLLRSDHIIDVASLTSRSIAQKPLDKETTEKILSATLHSSAKHPLMDCYEPHHLFVFYSFSGEPVACIEVCLSCNRVRMLPYVKDTRNHEFLYETADLVMIARILSDAGLPLTPYKSFEEFHERVKKANGSATEKAEQ